MTKGWHRESKAHAMARNGIKVRGNIFAPSKSPKYSAIVSIETIGKANQSVKRLAYEFHDTKMKAKRAHIVQVANLASNRAMIMAKNERLHEATRSEKLDISRIYRRFVNVHKGNKTSYFV
jgi:hypothetical protein